MGYRLGKTEAVEGKGVQVGLAGRHAAGCALLPRAVRQACVCERFNN